MNYKILWDKNRTRLEQKIIDEVKNGWELQGGASITAVPSTNEADEPVQSLVWCQAIIKR